MCKQDLRLLMFLVHSLTNYNLIVVFSMYYHFLHMNFYYTEEHLEAIFV